MSFSHLSPRQRKKNQRPQSNETFLSRFLALAQESADVLWILTSAGEMQEMCSSWRIFTGQAERACLGRGWQDALHPVDQSSVAETLSQCVTTGVPVDAHCSLRRYDNTYRRIHIHAIPVHLSDGSIREIMVCGRDITQQGQHEGMSEAQMQLAVNAARVGMWDLDLLTDQLVWSDQCQALFGLLPGTSISHEGFLAAIHPDDREYVDHITNQSLASHTEFYTDYRIIWPDGSIHWLTDRGRGIYNAQGRPVHIIGAVMDITRLKHAEEALRESEGRFRRFVESNLIGITVSDLEGTIREANDAFLALVGYTREDLARGRVQLTMMTPPQFLPQAEQAMKEILTTGTCQPFETEYLTKDGKRVPALIGGTRISAAGSASLVMGFVLDLSAQKESERQKDLFLAMTSHEMRTPLTALKGTLQLLERRMKRLSTAADQYSPEVNTFVKALEKDVATSVRQVDMQTRLINDLLDVSRITANTLELSLQCCDLVPLVRETVEDLRVMVPERSLLLELPEHTTVPVLVDRNRISQVVTNYVTNALRYSSPEQPVHIGLSVQGDRVRVWVRDRGPGLSEKAQKEIWQRFHQVKEVPVLSGSGKGLGLGLYICLTLIAQHQGEVGVESTPGAGSTFWFRLPLVK